MTISYRMMKRFHLMLLVGAFMVISASLSLGVVGDWNVLDHLAMVDRVKTGGTLYSAASDFPTMASSNYFPGLSYILMTVQMLVPEAFLVETMHFIGLLALLWFFYIQFLISKDMEEITAEHFAAIWFFLLFCCFPTGICMRCGLSLIHWHWLWV